MAITTKRFKPSFLYTYRNGVYANSVSPVRSAGDFAYHSVIGFPQDAIDAIRESKTAPRIKIRWRVTDGGIVAFGAHKKSSDDRQPSIYYSYIGIERNVPTGWYTQDVTDGNVSAEGVSFKNALLTRGYRGLMFYGAYGQNYMQGYGITSDSNSMEILIEGTFDDVPNKPTNLSPSAGATINALANTTFTWRHNGTGEASDPHQYRIAYKLQSSSTWSYFPSSTDWATSSISQHTFPPNTFTNGQWVWQVKTRARNYQESPWSNQEVYNVANILDSPPITSPSEGQTITTDLFNVTWQATNQRSYQLYLYDSADNLVFSESKITSSNTTSIAGVITSGQTYTILLSIIDNNNNSSAVTERTFVTNFVRPKQPLIDVVSTTDGTDHIISYTVVQQEENTVNFLGISHVNLYVKVTGVDDDFRFYERSDDIASGSEFYFYLFGSGVSVEYMLEAVSVLGTSNFSDVYAFESTFEHAYLSILSEPADQLAMMINDSRSEDFDVDSELMKFLGRKKPVPEFGIGETSEVSISCTLDNKIDLDKLKRFKRVRKKLYYRDSYGRSMVCIISSGLSIKDREISGYDVGFTVTEVDGGVS